MKSLKLKPLYLKANDILIEPPSFQSEPSEYSIKNTSTMTLSSLNNLKSILRGRKLNSSKNNQASTEDKESVLKLSEFKPRDRGYTKSPLTKKYTFRRALSNSGLDSSPTLVQSPKKIEEKPTISKLMHTITSREKGKIKTISAELHRFAEHNKVYEHQLLQSTENLRKDIDSVSESIFTYKSEILDLKSKRAEAKKQYDENMNSIAFKETEHVLSTYRVKGKKKTHLEVSQEREYFTMKEQLRSAKRDLHSNFIEKMESMQESLQHKLRVLDTLQETKKTLQKQLKEAQENLLAFHCKNLREGMDLREDGIR